MAYTEVEKAISLLPEHVGKLFPQTFVNSYLFHRLVSGARRYKIYDELLLDFYSSPPSAGSWITRNSRLPEGQQTRKYQGSERNRYLAVPMSWDKFDEWERDKNPNTLYPLMEMQAAEMAWAKMRNMSSAVFNGNGSEQPIGLSMALAKQAPSAQNAVIHSVDKALRAWYRHRYVQLSSNFGNIAAGTSIPAGILAFRTAVSQSRQGAYQATDVVTTKDIFEMFERYFLEIDAPQRMISKEEDAYIGFIRFRMFGSWLTWDDNCPADSIYHLRIGSQGQEEAARAFGDPKNKQKLDWDFEEAMDKAKFELDTSISIASNPNVKDLVIEPRTSLRGLQMAKWIVDSFNLLYPAMSHLVVCGSDNGSRWSTWS